jgi:hypothetical protein
LTTFEHIMPIFLKTNTMIFLSRHYWTYLESKLPSFSKCLKNHYIPIIFSGKRETRKVVILSNYGSTIFLRALYATLTSSNLTNLI